MKIIKEHLKNISPDAMKILQGGLKVTVTFLFASLILGILAQPHTMNTYYMYRAAETMRDMAPISLFICVIGSAMVEEQVLKSKSKK